MKKNILIALLVSLLISACAAGAEATATEVANDPPQDLSTEQGASIEPQPTATPFTTAEEPCKPYNLIDEILGEPYPGLPPVSDDDWAFGPADAAVTILEYSEFQCPYCAQLEPLLTEFQAAFPDDVRLVFRHWPLGFHDKAPLAGQASEAAGRQGKFVEFKNMLFEQQGNWAVLSVEDFEGFLINKAEELGLNTDQFAQDLKDEAIVKKIAEAANSGTDLGLPGTPTIFLNGYQYEDQRTLKTFEIYLQLIKHKANTFSACPEITLETEKTYTALVNTTQGDINIELFDDIAPIAVNSFIFLAENGWYDNISFFGSNAEYIFSGDPSNTGFGGPGYGFIEEISEQIAFTQEGLVSMYSPAGPGKNGGVFFITKAELSSDVDGLFTIFGKVISGMEIVNKLGDTDSILSITINKS